MTLAKNEQPFLALQSDGLEILRANMPAITMNPWDMDRVKVPAGGSVTLEIPDLDEGVRAVKSLEGIILHFSTPRSYWAHGLDDDENDGAGPPDCSSTNGQFGNGNPGGECATCPMNVWGTATKGSGKACKEKRMLFLLQPNAYLPLLVQVPTMSIKALNQYMMRLATSGTMYHNVVTGLSLEKTQQRGAGNTFSKMVFRLVRRLTDTEQAAVKELAAQFKAVRQTAAPPNEYPQDEEAYYEEQALNDR